MRQRWQAFPSLGLAMALAFAGAPAATAAGQDHDDVMAAINRLIAADNAGDLEGVAASYAEDALLIPPAGAAHIRGRAAIREHYRRLFAAQRFEIELDIEEIEIDGGLAYVIGTTGGFVVSRSDGERRRVNDDFLMVLRRASTSEWLVARLIWNAAPARAAASAR